MIRDFAPTARPGARSEVRVGGYVLGGVCGFTLTDDVRSIPQLRIDVLLVGGTEVSGEADVIVPESTRETLIALGWTPPAEGPSDPTLATYGVLAEVASERVRQNAKWGEQNHPDGTDATMRADADDIRAHVERNAANGDLTWHDVLSEEFAEATAETDPARLRAELVQVAAVAVAWVEAIDRRQP